MADNNEFGVSLDDAVSELQSVVEEGSNFMFSEFTEDWEKAEAYYAGECDLPIDEGRSSIVKTETRDIIRALMPNVMRILLQAKKPVNYLPTSIMGADFADKQSRWINFQFMADGGYDVLYNAVLESLKLKAGPIKVYWEENARPEHIRATGLEREDVIAYQEIEDLVIEEIEERTSPTGGLTYDIRAVRYYQNGRVRYEAFPIYEFFCQRNASDLTGVHGHRRSVTVAEAMDMGLEYDDWRSLDNDDPRSNDASSIEEHRRGYITNQDESSGADIMNHEFLLTEAYCEYDLDGDGVPEKYVFYLGGTSYEYIHHEEIEDFCIALVSADPQPFTVIGRSVADITKQSQDNGTSILRAIVDNAHIANNPRPAADPTRTNFNDLMNNAIGAPIRTRGRPEIVYPDVPFTAQQLLPFLEYLERDAEMRVGVTKAARGLDPDAMQSTDEQAVMNTIELSQGQVELMVRNIINTGIIPLFKMALRLSVRHMDRRQRMIHKGAVVPVDLALFDPDLVAVPNVGIGTQQPGQKLSTLQFILQKQEQYMASFGLDNPFTSLSQIYNTLEEIAELGGIDNVGRYFTYIDKQAEAVIMDGMMRREAQQAEMQREMMPLDPGKAMVLAESFKSRMRNLEVLNERLVEEKKLQQRALEKAEELDFRRDDSVQERMLKLLELGYSTKGEENANIQAAQDATTADIPRRTRPQSGPGPTLATPRSAGAGRTQAPASTRRPQNGLDRT